MNKTLLIIILVLSFTGCQPKQQNAYPVVPDSFDDQKDVYPIYTSKNGDRIMRFSRYSTIVWVEDKYGNIKAIARH